MNPRTRRLVVCVLAATVWGVLAVAAWAFWTHEGLGTAGAVGGSFDAPVLVDPTVSAGIVTLTWTPAPPPGTGLVDYVVERRLVGDTAWAPACATSATEHTEATTCSDRPGDGTWEWHVVAYFHTWTATSDASEAVNVNDPDGKPPKGSVTFPTSNTGVRGTVEVTANATDAGSGVASVQFQRTVHAGSSWTDIDAPDVSAPYSVPWDTNAEADGLYDLRVIITDNAGNTHTSAVVANVRVDNTAPSVSFALNGATGAVVSGTTVSFDPTAAGRFRLSAIVVDTGSGPASASFPDLVESGWSPHDAEIDTTPSGGPYLSSRFRWSAGAATPAPYVVTVTDDVGNSATATITFVADSTGPTSVVTAPAAGANVRASAVPVTATAVDDAGVSSVQIETSPSGAATWSDLGSALTTPPYATTWDTTAFADGRYDVRVVATDDLGHVATSEAVTGVQVDNTAPTVSLTMAPGAIRAFTNGTKVSFKSNAAGSYGLVATVSDAGSGPASVSFPVVSTTGWSHAAEVVTTPSGGPFTSSAFSWSSGASTPGTYTVTVADAAGNTATTAATFAADVTAPTGSVTAPVAAANVRGNAVSVTSSSADATSGVASAQFQSSPAGATAWSNLGVADTVAPYATTWDTTTFTDGLYDLRVVTTDNVGNTFTSAAIANVRVDNTMPTGSITAPSSNGLLRGAISMTIDSADGGSGVTSVQFQRSPAGTNTWTNQGSADTTAPYAVTWTTTSGTPDGRYDLRAITTDKAGNTFTAPAVTDVRVDNTAPAGAVTSPSASANVRGSAVTVSSSSADAGSGVATVQFQSSPHAAATWTPLGAALTASPYTTTWDTTGYADALYDLRVITTDAAGNVTTSATIANVRVDNTAPTGVVTAPVTSANVRATVSVTSNSADGGSGVASALFQISNAGAGSWANIAAADTTSPYAASWVTTGYPAGLYDLRVVTTDKAGNTFTSVLTTNVLVDNTAPTVSLTTAAGATGAFKSGTKIFFKSNAAGSFGLVTTVTDAGSGPASAAFPVQSTTGWTHAVESVTTPSGGPFTSSAFSWSSGASTPGTYTVTVADAAGNTATSAVTFTADATAPTGAVTAPVANANVRGATVSVTSSSTDASSGVASAQFQSSPAGAATWSDLGAADTATPYAASWNATTFTDGLYDLRVITTDNVGNMFTSATIANVRVDNTAPTGSVTAPASNAFVSGASVAVSANSADTGGGVASVQFQTSPRDASTWTNLGAADTTSPYGVAWNTTSGYPDGRYDLRAVTIDKAGNSSTSAVVRVEVQNAAPTVTAVQLVDGAGTAGRVQPGDQIVVTYSQTLGVATLCSTWSGNLTAQSLSAANDVTVTLLDGGAANDTVTVASATCTFHLGTLNLGSTGYVTGGSRTFSGSGSSASTIAWDPATRTLTITLGASGGLGTVGTVASSIATDTPDAAIKNAVATAITGSFATGALPQF
jgi:Bacterial Ig domain/Bacterial Ig-like domain (group 3)